MWNSQTYGKLELEQIPEKLNTFYNTHSQYGENMEITIGTDSNLQDKSNDQDTEAFSAQLWEALFENEMGGGPLS